MNDRMFEDAAEMEDSEFGKLLAEDLSEDLGGDTKEYVNAAEADVEASFVISQNESSMLATVFRLTNKLLKKFF